VSFAWIQTTEGNLVRVHSSQFPRTEQWSTQVSELDQGAPEGAVRLMGHLDLLTDEPLELAVALAKLSRIKEAGGSKRDEWHVFLDHLEELVEALKKLNEPTSKEQT
jgi:hypothetical protein